MTPKQKQAIWILGACQCVFWGVLYYGFSVVLVPIEHALGISQQWVAGAFSLGLLAMAFVAPRIGKAFDRGQGFAITRLGGALAVVGLVLLSNTTTASMLYVAWILLGFAMALLLYESAFALVIRAIADSAERLRALAAVTVMGGLASTIFLPLIAIAVDRWGWRVALLCAAMIVLMAIGVMERFVLPALPSHALPATAHALSQTRNNSTSFPSLVIVFTSSSLASMSVTTLLIPLLMMRGVSAAMAATVLATLGLTQLPGRLWMLRGGKHPSVEFFTSLPLALQGIGLLGVAISLSSIWAAISIAVFGLGAGLHTLARPWLVQQIYGVQASGYWNGRLARLQGFARAAAPILVVAIATVTSMATVLLVLSGVLFVLVPLARRMTHEFSHTSSRLLPHVSSLSDK